MAEAPHRHAGSGHTASHGHGHRHGHGHGEGSQGHDNERRVLWALLLTGGFMAVEVAGGLIYGSLALPADAEHMLPDTAPLAPAWIPFRIPRRPAALNRSPASSPRP